MNTHGERRGLCKDVAKGTRTESWRKFRLVCSKRESSRTPWADMAREGKRKDKWFLPSNSIWDIGNTMAPITWSSLQGTYGGPAAQMKMETSNQVLYISAMAGPSSRPCRRIQEALTTQTWEGFGEEASFRWGSERWISLLGDRWTEPFKKEGWFKWQTQRSESTWLVLHADRSSLW